MKPLTRKQEVAPKGNRRDKKSKMHVFANHDHDDDELEIFTA